MNDYVQERRTKTTVDGLVFGHWYHFIFRGQSGDANIGPFQFKTLRLKKVGRVRQLFVFGLFADKSLFQSQAKLMHLIYEVDPPK